MFRRMLHDYAGVLAGWDKEIMEIHHNQKADAPSGTAKLLLQELDPEGTATVLHGREGLCGKRKPEEIGVFSLRGGTVAGEHTVYFFGEDETLQITHRAASRRIFAANLITIFLGISIAFNMHAVQFLKPQTLLIMGLGLVAFIFDTAGGVLVAKFLNLFLPKGRKINPMIGAAGISAFPMSSRVIHKMGLKEDPQNFLLMHTVGVNVSGQIASVIAGGLIMSLVYTIG